MFQAETVLRAGSEVTDINFPYAKTTQNVIHKLSLKTEEKPLDLFLRTENRGLKRLEK